MKTNRLAFLVGCLLISASSFSQNIRAFFMHSGSCGTNSVNFYDSSFAMPPGYIVQWSWNFGDPSSPNNTSAMQHPVHNYSSPGRYNVHLKVTDNLGNADSTFDSLDVNLTPVLAYPSLPNVCIGAGPTFIGTASVTNGVSIYGIGYSGTGVSPTGYINPATAGVGTHTITAQATSTGGCTGMISQTITVVPGAAAAFTFNSTGCAPATVNFTNNSTGSSTYLWSFGDGSSSTSVNPSHIYTSTGTYVVKLKASGSGCSDSIIHTITVGGGAPTANFTWFLYDSLCFKNEVFFGNNSTNATSYSWNFGDGNTSTGTYANHIYQLPGTYYVVLTATNGCGSDTALQVITIAPENKAIKPAMPGTLIANRQCEADSGWTNFYYDNGTPNNINDDTLLLGLKMNGQYLGYFTDGTFEVKLSATQGAGSNTGVLLTNPLITNPTGYWVMNRYWNVQPTYQPTSPVGVRFYFNTQDLNDVNGSYPTHNLTYNDLIFYKTTGGNPDPTSNLAGATAITSIMNGSVADNTHWVYKNLSANRHSAEFTVSHFSGGGGGGTGNKQTLPLNLVSFDAKRAGKEVKLQWNTAAEVNLKAFEVQRSFDGAEFNTVETVRALGRNGSANAYSYVDKAPSSTRNYYRLKMIDNDGKFTYSAIRVVAGTSDFGVALYPNPAKDVLYVQMESKTANQIQILSIEGKVLSTREVLVNTGVNVVPVNISGLKSGNYLVKCIYAGGNAVKRFVKM